MPAAGGSASATAAGGDGSSGDKATVLVRQLLAFSRRQVLELADLDLNDVVGAMMKILARAIGEHVLIDFIPGHDLGAVRADRAQCVGAGPHGRAIGGTEVCEQCAGRGPSQGQSQNVELLLVEQLIV